MNDQISGTAVELPELSQTSIDRIESAVFAQINQDRAPSEDSAPHRQKKQRRRRGWLTGLGVAAAFAAGILIAPPLLNITGVTSGDGGFSAVSAGGSVAEFSPDSDMAVPEGAALDSVPMDAASDSVDREIITNARATVRVDDISAAVEAIAALADDTGGYVESTDISADPQSVDASASTAPGSGYGWISIRVPSANLTGVIDGLGDTGEVLQSSIAKQDVTSVAIDLRARVDATTASVDRLTELMAQSGSVSELIEAEVALTDRQAQLESYTQQLTALEDQVAMSSLQVELLKQTSASVPEPAGFTDGLMAGWNGLVVSLNALVIAIGFILPWLLIAGAVGLLIWLVRRRRRATAPDIP